MKNNIAKIRTALEWGEGPVFVEALAALAELEKAAAEPVAWMWDDMLGISHTFVSPKRPTWPDAGASPEMAVAINVRPLYAAPPAPVAEIREVVVTDEMCDSAYLRRWKSQTSLSGAEPDDEDRQWAREWLAAWRAELGPTLGLVELKEPTPEECGDQIDRVAVCSAKDARLIAAAPELVGALSVIVDYLGSTAECGYDPFAADPLIGSARAALAKAGVK